MVGKLGWGWFICGDWVGFCEKMGGFWGWGWGILFWKCGVWGLGLGLEGVVVLLLGGC